MFSDPLSITVSGSAKTLPRVSVDGSSTVYSTDDGLFEVRVSHVKNKRKRSVIRINQKKVAADPLLTERNVETIQAAYLVLDAPVNGLYTSAEQKGLIDALMGALQASTGALTTKFVAGES